jgi:hypothetical protein
MARSGQLRAARRACASKCSGISPSISTMPLPKSSAPNTSGAAIAQAWCPWQLPSSIVTRTADPSSCPSSQRIGWRSVSRIGNGGYLAQWHFAHFDESKGVGAAQSSRFPTFATADMQASRHADMQTCRPNDMGHGRFGQPELRRPVARPLRVSWMPRWMRGSSPEARWRRSNWI